MMYGTRGMAPKDCLLSSGLPPLDVYVEIMSDDGPRFGYGRGRRPLWSERDRDAERVRDALRRAGLAEFGDDWDGFVVEGGREDQPFAVAFTGSDTGVEEPRNSRWR
ncbi:hypothetical protein [Streptosporangium canum]|uniref:hypothetical protein n=1 Tax=Streptosporangium canum TaxID=324952 RepID=UPI0037B8EBC6